MTKEELQKVRDALETAPPGANTGSVMEWSKWYANRKQAIAILDAALAQPEHEPVGHLHSNGDFCQDKNIQPEAWPVYLYAAPVAQANLVEVLKAMVDNFEFGDMNDGEYAAIQKARAALAAAGEK